MKTDTSYLAHARAILEQIADTQAQPIRDAATILADTIQEGQSIFSFG